MPLSQDFVAEGIPIGMTTGAGFWNGVTLDLENPIVAEAIERGHERLIRVLAWALAKYPIFQQAYLDTEAERVEGQQREIKREREANRERRKKQRELPIRTVYLIQGVRTGITKIGVTNNVQTRLAALDMASPEPLRLIHSFLGTEETEGKLHAEFADRRSHREWFSLTQDDIDSIIAQYPSGAE